MQFSELLFITFLSSIICFSADAKEVQPIFAVKDGSKYCLLANFQTKISIPDWDKKDSPFEVIPQWIFDSASTCDTLKVSAKIGADQWQLDLKFAENSTEKTYDVQRILLTYFGVISQSHIAYTQEPQFKVKINEHYKCNSKQNIKLGGSNNVTMRFKLMAIQAFNGSDSREFKTPENQCLMDLITDNTTAIAVAVVLLLCILIAVIVFVVFNRRRSRP